MAVTRHVCVRRTGVRRGDHGYADLGGTTAAKVSGRRISRRGAVVERLAPAHSGGHSNWTAPALSATARRSNAGRGGPRPAATDGPADTGHPGMRTGRGKAYRSKRIDLAYRSGGTTMRTDLIDRTVLNRTADHHRVRSAEGLQSGRHVPRQQPRKPPHARRPRPPPLCVRSALRTPTPATGSPMITGNNPP
jgi:hypothetical protein